MSMSLGPVAVAMPPVGASASTAAAVAPPAVAPPSTPKAELGREVLRAAFAAWIMPGVSAACAAGAASAEARAPSASPRGASAFVAPATASVATASVVAAPVAPAPGASVSVAAAPVVTAPVAAAPMAAAPVATAPAVPAPGASASVAAASVATAPAAAAPMAAAPAAVPAASSQPASITKAYTEPLPVSSQSWQQAALPGVSVRVAPAERVGLSATVAVPDQLPPTASVAADDVTPKGASAVALANKDDMVAEAQRVQQEFSALAVGGSAGNRAYLERLSKAAAEAAAKGYGVKRMTHTVRRTRVRKTTNTTDLRTMETETNTEEQAHVDSWMEEGSPTVSGVGIMCARGTRVFDRYSDGSEVVQDAQVKGGCMFWLGGDSSSVQTTSFQHQYGPGNCRGDSRARWARSSPPMARIAAF